jgi:3-hydroxyisobutyrate dehydrogenase-like beta-hydroxyacid dehydrogenase
MGDDRSNRVAILGCGLLGSAAARVLAAAGYEAVAWNRSPERALALEPSGVRAVASIEEAMRSAGVVLVAVTNYDAVEQVLAPVERWDRRGLVVLTTGVPDDASRIDRWLRPRGAAYLDAAVLGYPSDLGADRTVVVASGSPDAWRLCEPVLRKLAGAARHVSDDVTGANALDVAATGAFYTVALGAFVEAAAYGVARGLEPRDVVAGIEAWWPILRRNLDEAAAAIASDRHETDEATVDVYLEAAVAWQQEMRDAGQRGALVAAMQEDLAAASEAGHGGLGFSAQSRTAACSSSGRPPR